MRITTEDLDSLATKIDGLDLNEEERTIVDGILEQAAAATETQVEGFIASNGTGYRFGDANLDGNVLSNPTAVRIARALFPDLEVGDS